MNVFVQFRRGQNEAQSRAKNHEGVEDIWLLIRVETHSIVIES